MNAVIFAMAYNMFIFFTVYIFLNVLFLFNAVEQIKNPVNPNLIPGECLYLNRTALSKVISNQPTPAKHFTLRRKPKSAELRAKITQKGIYYQVAIVSFQPFPIIML